MTRQPFDKKQIPHNRHNESGSVVTAMIAAVSLVGLLGVATYNLMSGPFSTMARLNNETVTKVDMMAASRILIMNSVSGGSGDCDADGNIEPVAWRTGNGPTNGGLIPDTIGAPVTDAWGTDYGYCVWDLGTASDDVACGGPGLNRLDGTNDPLSGETPSQTVMALVSAGPDRQFSTTCINYVDGTTPLITKTDGTDDMIMSYAYAEASQATSALWTIKSGDDTTITIDKDIEIGTNVSMNKTTGLASFMGVHASGRLTSDDGIQVGDETNGAVCDTNNTGLVRFNHLYGAQGQIVIEQKARGYEPFSTASSAIPVEATFDDPPTAGNTVIAIISGIVDCSSANCNLTVAPSGVTDNEGNTYTMAYETTNTVKGGGVGYNGKNYIFIADNITTSGAPLTVTALTSSGRKYTANLVILEVSGLDPNGSFDIAGETQKGELTTGYPSGTTTTVSAGTNNQNNSLILAHFHQEGAPSAMTVTPEAGYATLYNTDTDTSGKTLAAFYKIQDTAGTVEKTWTHNSVSSGYRWGILLTLASFKGEYETVIPGSPGLEVCNGTNWVGAAFTPSSGSTELGEPTGGGYWVRDGNDIHHNNAVTTGGGAVTWSLAVSGKDGAGHHIKMLNNGCGADCFAEMAVMSFRDYWNTGPAPRLDGDALGEIRFHGRVNFYNPLTASIMTYSDGGGHISRVEFQNKDLSNTINTSTVFTGDMKTGIGWLFDGTDPEESLHILKESQSTTAVLEDYRSTTAKGPIFNLARARDGGSFTTANLIDGDIISRINYTGRDDDTYETFGRIEAIVNGTVSAGSIPTDISIKSGSQTSNLQDFIRIGSTGNVGFFNSDPQLRLDIDGALMLGNGSASSVYHEPDLNSSGSRLMISPHSFYCCELNTWRSGGWGPGRIGKGDVYIGRDNYGEESDEPLLAIGAVNYVHPTSIAIGFENNVTDSNSTAIGRENTVSNGATAIGFRNDADGANCYAIGSNIDCTNNGIAIGTGPRINSPSGTSVVIDVDPFYTYVFSTPNYAFISGGNWGVNVMNPAYTLDVSGTAGSSSSANWTNVSDARLKDLHGQYTKGLSDIMRLKPTVFNYKHKNGIGLDPNITHRGFIAQEVQEVFPNAISTRPDGYLDFDMHNISIAMINAAKELKQANDNLAESNAALRDKNEQTKQALKNIQMRVAHLREKLNEPHGNKLPFNGWLLLLGALAAGTTASVIAIRGKRHDK